MESRLEQILNLGSVGKRINVSFMICILVSTIASTFQLIGSNGNTPNYGNGQAHIILNGSVFFAAFFPIQTPVKWFIHRLITLGSSKEAFFDVLAGSLYSTLTITFGLSLILEVVGLFELAFSGEHAQYSIMFDGINIINLKYLSIGEGLFLTSILPAAIPMEALVFQTRWKHSKVVSYSSPILRALSISILGNVFSFVLTVVVLFSFFSVRL